MTEKHTLIVSHAGEDGWSVRHSKDGKVLAHYSSRMEAESAARRTVSSLGGGEVCVEVLDGHKPPTGKPAG
jgi:Uncharacterized protein conserved in bacteria (DUF2188)